MCTVVFLGCVYVESLKVTTMLVWGTGGGVVGMSAMHEYVGGYTWFYCV